MAGDERRPDDPGEAEEGRGHEEDSRQARASAEAERADIEREDELDRGSDSSVLPGESDEERTGVMRPPDGS